ncbi:MAG TPA: peptidylprolyl isomerase, partial [Thermoanaerobaculia bacterium]|nr:peptidylprolyl isomerase [Thermoanaerobaculia bacterium]
RLRVPLGAHPFAIMEKLEAAAKRPGTKLSALKADLGGKIDGLGPMSLAAIGKSEPKLPTLLAPLEPGQLSAPYRTKSGLEITEVVARTKAEPIPFDKVRDRVAARYVRQYTVQLYAKMSETMLRDVQFHIDSNAINTLRKAGIPEPDISVQQLETLLDRI